jgi:cell wall-associated NlpC family hydrolase
MKEGPADVSPPLSLAILALVLLPIGGCAHTPAQAEPDVVADVVPVQAAPNDGAGVALAPTRNDTSVAPASPVAPLLLAVRDAEDTFVVTLADPDADTVHTGEPVEDVGYGVARYALEFVGTPYVWGGNTPEGFDCSGLVQYSYARAGLEIPRAVVTQRKASRSVSRSNLRPGDLIFFHIDGKRYSHIGIYIGDDKFVHAPRTGKFVSTASLSNPYWKQSFGGARRPRALFDEVSSLVRVGSEN